MSTWDDDLDRAKQYIQNRDYYRARIVLERIPESHTAREWLKKLDKLENQQYQKPKNSPYPFPEPQKYAPQPQYVPQPQYIAPQQNVVIQQNFIQQNVRGIPSCAMFIVILNMVFWSCAIVATATMISPEAGANALIGVVFWFVILTVVYIFLWKFFWWTLAAGWTFMTLAFLIMLAAGTNLISQFQR